MGLEKIKEEILQKASAAEKEILAEASVKIDAMKKKSSDVTIQLEQDATQKLNSEIKTVENREQSLQNMELQRMVFEAKKEIMDKVYTEAFDKIKKIPKKDREKIINKFLADAEGEIDVGIVYANREDKQFCGKFEVKSLDTDGGIICETKDGTVRVNYTFTSIFHDLKEKTAKEVSKILFK